MRAVMCSTSSRRPKHARMHARAVNRTAQAQPRLSLGYGGARTRTRTRARNQRA